MMLLAFAAEAGAEASSGLSPWWFLVAILMIAFNAFFVAAEFSLVASRRVKLEPLVDQGSRSAARALAALSDLQRQLAGAQLGITLTSLVLGLVGEPVVAHYLEIVIERFFEVPASLLHTISLTISLTIVVFLHMVIGEMVPKNLALASPEKSLLWIAPANNVYLVLFHPLIWSLNALSEVMLRALGFEVADEIHTVHTAEEFGKLVDASRAEGRLEELEHTMLSGALDFGERHVSAVMVPRSQVVSVSSSMTLAQIEAAVVESGHTRLLMVGGTIDDVRGWVHAKDLLRLPIDAQEQRLPIETVRQVMFVEHGLPLDEVLGKMRASHVHFCVVRSDKRTLGIVTLEDVLEELVGEIEDETDPVDDAVSEAGLDGVGDIPAGLK